MALNPGGHGLEHMAPISLACRRHPPLPCIINKRNLPRRGHALSPVVPLLPLHYPRRKMALLGRQVAFSSTALRTAQRGRPARASRSNRLATVCKVHKICVLPGDGIGPEIMEVGVKALSAAGKMEGEEFEYKYCLIGGAAIDATGQPLPDETLTTAKASDAVLLAAIGGCAWQRAKR